MSERKPYHVWLEARLKGWATVMKNLSDQELMEEYWTETCARTRPRRGTKNLRPLETEGTAAMWECERRQKAASRIWKRLFNKSAYDKWVVYAQRRNELELRLSKEVESLGKIRGTMFAAQ